MSPENLTTVVAAILAAAVGLIPWFAERGKRKALQDEIRRRVWSDISKVKGLMADLEKDESQNLGGPGALQAVGKLSIMLRDLFREACSNETHLSVELVSKWRRAGKISSDWQEELILQLLHSEEIGDSDLEKLRPGLSTNAELPAGHKMSAK